MTESENERLEFKQSFSDWKAIVETVAAFASSEGGTILIGASDSGIRTGIAAGKGTLEDLSNKIKLNTEPGQFPSIRLIEDDGVTVAKITVAECPIKPVFAFGRPLKRVGKTNQRLSRGELARLLIESDNATWDVMPCKDFPAKELDEKAIRSYLKLSGLTGDPLTVLKNLKLVSARNMPLNGAVALFASRPAYFLPQVRAKCGRFAGVTALEFIDEKEIEGNIFDQLERCMSFVKEHTRLSLSFTGKLSHERTPQYPDTAVREAIVNALCHRDYSLSAHVQVRIFDDRLEVWSPGLLPAELSIEQLREMHESVPRNPRIAYALHRAGLAEQWGTGTTRMIAECGARGIDVDFYTTGMSFIVRFREKRSSPLPTRPAPRSEILDTLMQRNSFTRKEFEQALGLSKRQSLRELEKLIRKRIIRKIGNSSNIAYQVNKRSA